MRGVLWGGKLDTDGSERLRVGLGGGERERERERNVLNLRDQA